MEILVLIACEESQIICEAFRRKGIKAFSCDLQECSGGHPEWHIQGDAIKEAYSGKYTLMIGHPPCTYLSFAANRSWNEPGRLAKRLDALKFFADLWEAPIPFICLENPKSCASPVISKYTQEIQPYYFGDPFLKTTWLWLKNLPTLKWVPEDNLFEQKTSSGKPEPMMVTFRKPSKNYKGGETKKRYFCDTNNSELLRKYNIQFTEYNMNKVKLRSKTFPGIAEAMAEQWIPILNAFEKSNAGGENFKNGQISTNAISEHERSTCN
jgi:hypothetical protein